MPVFETGAFSHSATRPKDRNLNGHIDLLKLSRRLCRPTGAPRARRMNEREPWSASGPRTPGWPIEGDPELDFYP